MDIRKAEMRTRRYGALALLALAVLLTAAPALAVEWETYLAEDFNTIDSMFYTGQAGEAFYAIDDKGRYVIDGLSTGVDSLSALTDNLYYYYVEAECELLESTAGELAFAGLVFHYNKKIPGKLSYYVFYAYGDGYYGAKRVVGDQVEIVLPLNRSEMVDPGRPNILAVDCQGTRFDLYINGRYVDGFTDVRVDGGGCGFYVSKYSSAAFDNFAVKVEHRGGGLVPNETPSTVEGSSHGANVPSGPSMPSGGDAAGAGNGTGTPPATPPVADPAPGISHNEGTQPGSAESGHSFMGYTPPVIPKDPNRPTYPWEVGVDKTGKGNNGAAPAQPPGGSGGEGISVLPPRQPAGGPQAPPPGHASPPTGTGSRPEGGAVQLGGQQQPAAGGTVFIEDEVILDEDSEAGIPPSDLPGSSIRDSGEGGGVTQPVLPPGEELIEESPARPPSTPVRPPSQAGSGDGDPANEVVLVTPEEADTMLAQSQQPQQPVQQEQPKRTKDPLSAASAVTRKVSENLDAKPEKLAEKTGVESRPPAQPETAPVQPESTPAQDTQEPPQQAEEAAQPIEDGQPAEGTQPIEDTQREEPATQPADSGTPLSLYGGGTPPQDSGVDEAEEPASSPEQPADDTAADMDQPQSNTEEEPAPAAESGADEGGDGFVSLGGIRPDFGELGGSKDATKGGDGSSAEGADTADGGAQQSAPAPRSEAPAGQPQLDTPELPTDNAVPEEEPASLRASAYFSGPDAVLIEDDFSQENWPVAESEISSYRYFGAAYEVDNMNAETMAISFQEASLGDVELSVEAEHLDGASYVGYGVAARFSVVSGGVSYYGLFISRSGELLILKVEGGTEKVLKDWTPSTLITPSKPNRITLEVVGNRLTAYINGVVAASVTDGSLTGGGYALLAGPGTKVRYDNLTVRGYNQ